MKVFSIVVVVFALITGTVASAGILGKVKDAAGAVKDSTASAGSKAKGFVSNREGGDLFPLASAPTCTSTSPAAMSVKVDWLLGGVTKMSAAAVGIRDGQRTGAPRGADVFPLAIGEKVCPIEIRVRKSFVDMKVVTAMVHPVTSKEGQALSAPLWAEMIFRISNVEELESDQIRGIIGQIVEPVVPVTVSSTQSAPAPQSAQSAEMTSLDIGDPVAKVEKAAGAPIGHIGGQTVYSYLGVKIFVQDGKVVRTQ